MRQPGRRAPGWRSSRWTPDPSFGVTTSALGMGLGYDEAIIAGFARGGSGSELFAADADTAIPLIASEAEGLLTQSVQAASMLVTMAPAVAGVRILNDLHVNAVDGGALVELGGFLSGEERKVLLDFAVPGMSALGLAQIAVLEIRYWQLPELVEHVVTIPVHVNVVPDGDTRAALHLLHAARAAVVAVVPSAPAAQAEDLSADASYKSRTRGRRP